MGVTYGFFDKEADGETDASYSEDQGGIVFGAAVPDGVWPFTDDNCSATVTGGGTTVTIAPNSTAFAKGFFMAVDDDGEAVDIDGADASNRIDRIVARLDESANTMVPTVIKGTAGSVTPPALVRNDSTYDVRMWLATRGHDGSLNLTDDRDWGALEIHVTTSANQPPSNAGYALEYQTDTEKLIRRDGTGNRKTLLEDSGGVTLTPRGDWANSASFTQVGQRINGWVRLRIALDRTVAALRTTDTDGSPLLATLPANLRPKITEYGFAALGAGRTGEVLVSTAGAVTLFSISADVPVGAGLRATLVYPGA